MKTERRHELKTNELGAFLLETADWLKSHTTHITIIVVAFAAVVLGTTYAKRNRSGALDSAWQTLSQLSFTQIDADASFREVDQIIADTDDPDLKMVALTRKAQSAMRLILLQGDGFHPEFLDIAEQANRSLVDNYPDRSPIVGLGLSGLATIEECRFVIDQDLAHRDVAKAYLERLQNESQFKGTPFQTDAAQRLQRLDNTFEVVSMAQPTAPEQLSLPPLETQPLVPPIQEDQGQPDPPVDEATDSTSGP